MEKQLFTWGSWDLCDTLFITFMNCVFIKDVGKYKAETKHIVLIWTMRMGQ